MERLRNCGYYGLEVMRLSPLAEIRNCFISGPSGGKNIVLKERGKKRNSLYVEWIWFLFAAGAVSLLFFMSGRFVMEEWIYRCYTDRNVTRSYDEKYTLKLQKYISENGISTKEIRKLDDWTEDSRNTYIQIKKEEKYVPAEYRTDEMYIYFENRCREDTFTEYDKKIKGHNIGIRNVRMMEAMNGKCEVIQEEKTFRVCLGFRWYKEY